MHTEEKYRRLGSLLPQFRSSLGVDDRAARRLLLEIDITSDIEFSRNRSNYFTYLCRRVTGRLYERMGSPKDLGAAIFSYEKASRSAYMLGNYRAKLTLKKKILELKKKIDPGENVAYANFFLADALIDLRRLPEAHEALEEGIKEFGGSDKLPNAEAIRNILGRYHSTRKHLKYQGLVAKI